MTTKLPAWIGRRASRMLPLVGATVLTLAACASPPAEPSVALEITPDVAAVVVGGSRSFTTSATGVSDASASWSLSDDCGSLQVESATRVTYTAPDDVPGAPCVLTATSLEVAGLTASVAIEVYDVPTLTFGADTAFARPFRSVTFSWSLGELPPVSSLRCELHALGAGTPVTATFEACGDDATPDSYVHVYDAPGEYEPILVVYHDEDRLRMGDWAIEVRNVLERISTGRNHSLAVDSVGDVVAWGKNGNGRLGDGSNTDRSVPIFVCRSGSAGEKTCATFNIGPSGSVSAGAYHSLALDADGYVWAWGDNGQGQLGIGTSGAATGTTNPTPVCASGSGPDCVQLNLGQGGAISAGRDHSLALDGDGGVWAWGGNETGELGDGTMTESPIPNPVRVCATGAGPDCTPFVLASGGSIIAGEYVSLALSVGSDADAEQGVVWSWGWNGRGVLGTGTIGDETSRANPGPVCASGSGPSCVPLALGPRGAISAGEEHALASDTSGGVWSWGRNADGQLGDGTSETRLNPVPVCAPNGGTVCAQLELGSGASVGAGSFFSFAVSGDGELWAWGWNHDGQLGDGTSEARSVPVAVCAEGSGGGCRRLTLGSGGVVAAGEDHTTALHAGGNAWAWGRNNFGQLGDGTTEDSSNPVAVSTPLWW